VKVLVLIALVAGLAVVAPAQIAQAYVVAVTTTVAMPATSSPQDTALLRAAVKSAIQDVLDHAIGFAPTVVTLEEVRVVGDRLYLVLLIADKEGESLIEALSKQAGTDRKPDAEDRRSAPAPSTTISGADTVAVLSLEAQRPGGE